MTKEEKLKIIRKELHLTQDEFATRLNISRSAIGNIEYGRQIITPRLVNDICEKFDINYQWFVEDKDVPMFVPHSSLLDDVAKKYDLNEYEQILLEYILTHPSSRLFILQELENISKLKKGD